MIQQLLFLGILLAAGYFLTMRIKSIKRAILLGKPIDRSDQPQQRLQTMLRIAFGQKKMFDRPVVGMMHFVIYIGFVLINIEIFEIIIDGLTGQHRIFSGILGGIYRPLINFFELLALGVLLVCIIFLWRRNISKVERLNVTKHSELNGFPVIDANVILIAEIVLMLALFTMNATDSILQTRQVEHYPVVGSFWISSWLVPIYNNLNTSALLFIERVAWWFHIIGIFSFAIYVSYSKHLHIFLAFPNTYFANLTSKGNMPNMPEVTQEVKIMLGTAPAPTDGTTPARFGAKDIMDLSWKNLMDAYSCTECGRCTSACPANMTGKALSPRKIMMDTRDRLETVAKVMDNNNGTWEDDGKTLYQDHITAEELRACTTCNACVEACPILISPMDIILQMRRYQIMEENNAPNAWNGMFANIENNQAPWKMPAGDRLKWAESLEN